MGQVWLNLHGPVPRVSTAFNTGAAPPFLRGGQQWRLIMISDGVVAIQPCQRLPHRSCPHPVQMPCAGYVPAVASSTVQEFPIPLFICFSTPHERPSQLGMKIRLVRGGAESATLRAAGEVRLHLGG